MPSLNKRKSFNNVFLDIAGCFLVVDETYNVKHVEIKQ